MPGTPGEVALFAMNFNSDWSKLKSYRALKRLHYVFAPVARIEIGQLSEPIEAADAPEGGNSSLIANPFAENTILRMANNELIMLPLESDLASPFNHEESGAVVPANSSIVSTLIFSQDTSIDSQPVTSTPSTPRRTSS